jgi:hypothetical protein
VPPGRLAAAPADGPAAPVKAAAPVVGPDPRLASAEPRFAVMNWEPPGIDESKPEVAAGVAYACPTEMVLNMAGRRVKRRGAVCRNRGLAARKA